MIRRVRMTSSKQNEMHLVVNKPTMIDISSKDVIHSFSLHHMRM